MLATSPRSCVLRWLAVSPGRRSMSTRAITRWGWGTSRLPICHPERSYLSVIPSEARDLLFAGAHSRSILFGVARAMRALPLLAASGAGASAPRLRPQIDDLLRAPARSRSLVATLLGMTALLRRHLA